MLTTNYLINKKTIILINSKLILKTNKDIASLMVRAVITIVSFFSQILLDHQKVET